MRLMTVSVSLLFLFTACGEDGDLLLPTGPPPLTDMEDPDTQQQQSGPCFDMTVDEFDTRVAPYLDGELPPEYIPLSYELDTFNDRVSVCYDYVLDVTATAATALVREFSWDIDVRAERGELILAPGQLYLLPYVVEVTAAAADRNWSVFGSILIENDSPFKATVTGIRDAIHGIPVATFCGFELPHTLGPGDYMSCAYWLKLPSDVAGVARVEVATQGRVGPGYASKGFDFGDPLVSTRDECVRVFDGFAGQLGQVCGHSASFDLTATVGGFDQCGQYQWGNTARIEADEWTMGDGWSLSIEVPCENGGQEE